MDDGAVMVYQWTGYTWMSMPRNWMATGGVMVALTSHHGLEHVKIDIMASDFTDHHPTSDMLVKVVVIAGSARIAHPDLDFSDYTEVAAAFGLE